MKQYLLSVWGVDGAPTPPQEEIEASYRDVETLNNEIQAAGAWVFAGGLHPSSTATVVSVDNGRTITTDGPFAESKEQLGGFWVLNCEDLDAAIDWAAKATVACKSPVEVRPFQDDSG